MVARCVFGGITSAATGLTLGVQPYPAVGGVR